MSRLWTIIAFLGSRTLTLWLIGAFVLYYMTVAVWQGESFGRFVVNLGESAVIRLAYLLFLVNISMRVSTSLGSLWRSKARFFLRLPLYCGLLALLASFFLGINARDFGWFILGEGDVMSVPWDESPYQVAHIEPAVDKRKLMTEGIRIFDYEPSVVLTDRDGKSYTIGAFPPKRVRSSFMHILNFGIGPAVELKKRGNVVGKGAFALRLIPFGNVDSFEIAPHPYRFYVSILPNRIIKKGKEAARDYDLTAPLYRVEVVKGDKTIAREETGGSLSFDGDMTLTFSTPSDWVHLEVVHDPYRAWFIAGLMLLFAGMALYPFSYFFGRHRERR